MDRKRATLNLLAADTAARSALAHVEAASEEMLAFGDKAAVARINAANVKSAQASERLCWAIKEALDAGMGQTQIAWAVTTPGAMNEFNLWNAARVAA